MKHLKLPDGTKYDGSQIEPMWAFRQFKVKDSSIVSWTGPVEIEPDNLIDYEDVGLEIKGGLMLDFLGGGDKYRIMEDKYEGNFLAAINESVKKIMARDVETISHKDSMCLENLQGET